MFLLYTFFITNKYHRLILGQFVHKIPYMSHDDVIKWKHFPRYWPFVRGIHRSPVNSPHKGQWRGALMFSLICTRINGWVNNGEAGDLRRYCVHYDVIVMAISNLKLLCYKWFILITVNSNPCNNFVPTPLGCIYEMIFITYYGKHTRARHLTKWYHRDIVSW